MAIFVLLKINSSLVMAVLDNLIKSIKLKKSIVSGPSARIIFLPLAKFIARFVDLFDKDFSNVSIVIKILAYC